ncbi:MAG: zf-HC2 domain-containing protein [Actinomycetota bacterium]|nr:zf-HC2 domain-containing protein [Actinomycetota bacterium]
MTDFGTFGRNCERAREWSSLRLDGELPQLQRAMLNRHLTACGGCAAFDADLAATTAALRSAALQPLERPIVLPRLRRSALRAAPALAAAAALVVVFGLGPLVNPELLRPTGGAANVSRAPAGQPTVEAKLLHESRVLMRPGVKRGIGLSV